MNALGSAVLFCVIQVTVFAAVAGVLCIVALRREPARSARIAFASMIGVTLLTFLCWSPWPNWIHVMERVTPVANTPAHLESQASTTIADNGTSASHLPSIDVAPSSTTVLSWWEGMQQLWLGQVAPQPTTGWSWSAAVATVFILTGALGLARLAAGMIGIRRMQHGSVTVTDSQVNELVEILRAELGCRREVTIVECPALSTAATVGWRRPLVLLPTQWREWSATEL